MLAKGRRKLVAAIRTCWPLAMRSVNNEGIRKIIFGVLALATNCAFSADPPSLWPIQQTLVRNRFVDLTHEFAPGIPRWPGFSDETRTTIYWYEKRPDTIGAGFFSELFTHVGQWGTHGRSASALY